jgi:exopolyphosphatase/guanosine-5'-triphosphate,3'-diphosphate pyrophosphatase
LDVGSNTVHLLVVDADPGARPMPAADIAWDSPLLDELVEGELTEAGRQQLLHLVLEAHSKAEELGVADFSAFATSALRDATNADDVLSAIATETGIQIAVLDGDDEARLTYLAARRWHGWASGRLLVVDIGGGSLELAVGPDEVPESVASLPLGARRLTRDFLIADPPRAKEIAKLRDHVSGAVAERLRPFRAHPIDVATGTSKTLRSLARIAGAAPSSEGPFVRRALRADDANNLVDKLADLSAKERAKLPGVSARRAPQLLAGAVVAATAMGLLEIDELVICPWALREGIFLTRQDWIVAF